MSSTARKQTRARPIDAELGDEIEVAPPKSKWEPTGKRRLAGPALNARRLHWPSGGKERFELLDFWFYIAPQIAGPAVAATLLALRKVVMSDSGSSWASNDTIARWAGQLSLAKVKRDLAIISHRGLIASELGWREDANGKWRKTRTMFLAIPDPFPEHVQWPRSWSEFDASTLEEGLPRGADGKGRKAGRKQDNRLHVLTEEGLPRGAITLKGITSASSGQLAPSFEVVSPASDEADHSPNDAHNATARRPSGRASLEPPSIYVDHEEM